MLIYYKVRTTPATPFCPYQKYIGKLSHFMTTNKANPYPSSFTLFSNNCCKNPMALFQQFALALQKSCTWVTDFACHFCSTAPPHQPPKVGLKGYLIHFLHPSSSVLFLCTTEVNSRLKIPTNSLLVSLQSYLKEVFLALSKPLCLGQAELLHCKPQQKTGKDHVYLNHIKFNKRHY